MFDAPSRRRALPLPVRVRPVPARAARVVHRAPDPRRPRAHRRRRRRSHAAPPRVHREPRARACCSRSSSPMRAAGKVFNVGDEEVLSVRQVIEIVAAALDHELEIVSMPYDLALPARPLLAQPLPTHRVLDLTRAASTTSATATWCRRATALASHRTVARRPSTRARRHGGDRAHRPVRLRRRGPARSTRGSRRVTRSSSPSRSSPPRRATASRTAAPAAARGATRSSTHDRESRADWPARRRARPRPVDRATGPYAADVARRPGRRRHQGRATRLRRHRPLRRRRRSTASSALFQTCNRGKRSIAVDPHTDEGREHRPRARPRRRRRRAELPARRGRAPRRRLRRRARA